jgi:hypothetical protein
MKIVHVLASWLAVAASAAIPLASLSAQITDQAASELSPETYDISAEATPPVAPPAASIVTVGLGPVEVPAAFHTPIVKSAFIVTAPDGPHGGVGNNLALVGVGAIGTFAGIKIGGGVGGTIAVAGAALALYGLFRILR